MGEFLLFLVHPGGRIKKENLPLACFSSPWGGRGWRGWSVLCLGAEHQIPMRTKIGLLFRADNTVAGLFYLRGLQVSYRFEKPYNFSSKVLKKHKRPLELKS